MKFSLHKYWNNNKNYTLTRFEFQNMKWFHVHIHIQGVPKKKLTILNDYTFFNIHGRWMKQILAESWDFEILLHLSFYFSTILLLAIIWMRRLNSPIMRCRISTGIDTMISLTCSFIWIIVACIFFNWFHLSYNPKDKNVSG